MKPPYTTHKTTSTVRSKALSFFAPAILSASAMLGLSVPAAGQEAVAKPVANQIAVDMKETIGDRYDGKLALNDADGKKCEITVYYYRNTVSNKTQIVFILKDPAAEAGAATFAKLYPKMSPSLQCMTYMGEGDDLASAVTALEKRVQGLVGNTTTISVTQNDTTKTAKFVIAEKTK